MAQTKTKPNKAVPSPLKWHGGKGAFKGKLAQWIIGLMPPHLHYVEPYAGGLSVLLAKDPEGVSEVVNDKHRDLTNFWSVLGLYARFLQFKRLVEAIPVSEDGYHKAVARLQQPWERPESPASLDDVIERAAAFFVACRQSMSGRMKGFSPLTRTRTRRGMNEQASAWLSAIEGLPAVHARLSRVVVLNHDALDVICQQDGEQTCFYLDPPYVHETRGSTGEYDHEMTEAQHHDLLECLETIEGKFLLSGYDSPLYEQFRSANKWRRHDFPIVNNSSKAEKKETKVECVWTNF